MCVCMCVCKFMYACVCVECVCACVFPILWLLTKAIKGGGVTSHVDVFTALKYSNMIIEE